MNSPHATIYRQVPGAFIFTLSPVLFLSTPSSKKFGTIVVYYSSVTNKKPL